MNKEYAVIIGDDDIKVTRILPDTEYYALPIEERKLYDRDRSITKNFSRGQLVQAPDPFHALLEARKEIKSTEQLELEIS